MHFDQSICDAIAERFRKFNRKMAEINKRQAYVIDGAEVLPNARGTAPGQWLDTGRAVMALLPGPPSELKGLWEAEVMPRLQAKLRELMSDEAPAVIREKVHSTLAERGIDPATLLREASDLGDAYRALRSLLDALERDRIDVADRSGEIRRRIRELLDA
jgi:hypothetical protein